MIAVTAILVGGCALYGETHRSLNASRVAYGSINVQEPAGQDQTGEFRDRAALNVNASETQSKRLAFRDSDSDETAAIEKELVTAKSVGYKNETSNVRAKGKWFFSHSGKYTIQYTSVASKASAEDLAGNLSLEFAQQPVHVYEVKHRDTPYYIVLAGEYDDYRVAEGVAKERNGWVRNVSVLRKNRCDTADFLEARGNVVSTFCTEPGFVAIGS